MNDQPDFPDDPTARASVLDDRLRRHLAMSADQIVLPAGRPSEARRIARQRTIRRRRVVSGTVAAATVTTLVVGVQQLSSTGGERVHMVSLPDLDADNGAAASTAPGSIALTPALTGDPAFVWKVVTPGQEDSITATFNGHPIATFPTLALSTAPGHSNDYDNIQPVVWRTEDGIAWEQIELEPPFGRFGHGSVVSSGNLFALGTAPGLATTEPNPLQVAIAGLDAAAWTTVDLPIDTNDHRDLPFGVPVTESAAHPLADGTALVTVTPSVSIDLRQVAEANDDVDLDRVAAVDVNGVTVLGPDCDPDAFTTTIPISHNAITPDATQPPTDTVSPGSGSPDGKCAQLLHTWAELGVPDETVAAIDKPVTSFFHVTADAVVTPVDSPAPGTRLSPMLGGTIPVFAPIDGFGNYSSATSFRYTDGTWTTIPLPTTNWVTPPARLGDATVGWGWQDGGWSPYFARIGDDGSTTYGDVSAFFDRNTMVSPSAGAATSGNFVTPVEATLDRLAEAGGAELTRDGITLRQDSFNTSPYFVDAASGERIDDARIEHDDDAMIVTDAAGDELARFTWSEFDGLTSAYETRRNDSTWSLLTTADGVTFSVESVADLLGIDGSKIDRVSRVSSDGTQVVVIVTLNDRYPDESRKQLALVGTPLG